MEYTVAQELSRMLIPPAMPRDDNYRSNKMDASTVGNSVDDSCTKSIMDANSMSNAKHSNFYRSYVMDASSVSNAGGMTVTRELSWMPVPSAMPRMTIFTGVMRWMPVQSAMPGMTVVQEILWRPVPSAMLRMTVPDEM